MKDFLQTKRKLANLTQAQLARAVGVSEQYIYYIESGKRRPGVEVAKSIGKTLNFDWRVFYEGVKSA